MDDPVTTNEAQKFAPCTTGCKEARVEICNYSTLFKMNINQIYLISLIFSLPMILYGAMIKLDFNHGVTATDNSQFFLIIGLICTVIYFYLAISDLLASKKLSHGDKSLWIFGFLTFNWFMGVAYYLFKFNRG